MAEFVRNTFKQISQFEWVAILLVRLSVGTEFLLSGWGKLGDLEKFTKYFTELGIPAPALQAPFVATLEFAGGIGLILGLGTRFFAAPLAITMIVAILTATELSTLGNFLYLSEWNLFLLLTWLGFSGAGPVSVDQRIAGSDSSDGRAPQNGTGGATTG